MGTQDNDILGYFKDEHDQAEANTPSVDNLFSNRDGKPFVLPQSCLGLTSSCISCLQLCIILSMIDARM